ncbi:MAG: hypothetical protein ACR2H4_13850 [Pyrinomonadaceae bacterium]|jgi:hypothetical protein
MSAVLKVTILLQLTSPVLQFVINALRIAVPTFLFYMLGLAILLSENLIPL